MSSYDVIVVGAATTGAVAAKKLSQKGYKVLMVDAKPRNRIGDKACGDAIGEEDLRKAGVELPKQIIRERIQGADLYSPDEKTVFRVKGYGFTVDRIGLGRALVEEAEAAGVVFLDNFRVEGPLLRDGWVVGVRGKDEVQARVVLDASGNKTRLRGAMPDAWLIEKAVARSDAVAAFRVELKKPQPPIETGYLKIYFDQKTSPGGYIWAFPEGDMANIGVGVTMIGSYPNPKTKTYEWIAKKGIRGEEVVASGDTVPTRRPMANMVGNGIVFAGDAAMTVNPVTGGGIGSGMISASMAASSIASALESKDLPGFAELWDYNITYMKEYGVKQAGLDVFRRFLIHLSNDDINFGMSSGMMDEESVTKAALTGTVDISWKKEFEIVLAGLRRPSMLLRLRQMSQDVARAMDLYSRYPSDFDGLALWKQQADSFFSSLGYRGSPQVSISPVK